MFRVLRKKNIKLWRNNIKIGLFIFVSMVLNVLCDVLIEQVVTIKIKIIKWNGFLFNKTPMHLDIIFVVEVLSSYKLIIFYRKRMSC